MSPFDSEKWGRLHALIAAGDLAALRAAEPVPWQRVAWWGGLETEAPLWVRYLDEVLLWASITDVKRVAWWVQQDIVPRLSAIAMVVLHNTKHGTIDVDAVETTVLAFLPDDIPWNPSVGW